MNKAGLRKRFPSFEEYKAMEHVEMIQNMVSHKKELWELRKVEEELIDEGYLKVTSP